jgi:cytochrome c553
MKIILSAVLAFLLLGCTDDATSKTATKEISKQAHETAAVVAKSTEAVMQKAKEATTVVVEQVKEVSKATVAQVKEVSADVVKQVSEKSDEVAKSSAQVVQKVAKSTQEMAKSVQEKAKKVAAPAVPALDGSKLFTACAGCHGSHGEKKAMGKSQIIKGWDSAKVSAALHGYKDGTYGGAMKAIMKGQASKLSDDEIKAIGDYISKQ